MTRGDITMTQLWPRHIYYTTSEYYHRDVYCRLERMRKALSELQLRAGKKEMERSNSMVALEKEGNEEIAVRESLETVRREQEVASQLDKLQEDMERLRLENEELKLQMAEGSKERSAVEERKQESGSLASNVSFDSVSPLNSPDNPDNHLLKRLKEAEDRAYQAESRSDELNLLLNHKLIEINKLQLTLSSQTKDLIHLEKAYYQLRCHLHRNRKMSSPSLRRISTKLNKTS